MVKTSCGRKAGQCSCSTGGACVCDNSVFLRLKKASQVQGTSFCVCGCSGCGCNFDVLSCAPEGWSFAWDPAVVLDVEGMTCQSCAESIKGALMKNVDVAAVQVKTDEKKVKVQTLDGLEMTEDVRHAIVQNVEDCGFHVLSVDNKRKAISSNPSDNTSESPIIESIDNGYIEPGPIEVRQISIQGMTCGACVAGVERTVGALPGVQLVSVNLMLGRARVAWEKDQVEIDDILSCIERAGYEASIYEKEDNPHIRKLDDDKRDSILMDFIIALLLSIPVFLLNMVLPATDARSNVHEEIARGLNVRDFASFALSTPVQFYCGRRFYVGSYHSLRNCRANMDVLVAGGTTTAYISSVILLIIMMRDDQFHSLLYFETSALLTTFILLGKYLEMYTKGKTSDALYKLMDLQAKTALVVEVDEDGNISHNEREINATELKKGNIVKVLPGGVISADGEIIKGESTIDESMVTGESMPVDKAVGNFVIGGTINVGSSPLFIKATKVGAESMLAQIVQLVEDAQSSKAPIQAFADRLSSVFVPVVLIIAVITFIVWLAVAYTVVPDDWLPDNQGPFMFALLFFIATIVIACPCALGLATPTAVMVGSGLAAREGILIKGGAALQEAQKINALIFDKTGTLTYGKPEVTDIFCFLGYKVEKILELAGLAESSSEHPLGRAIYRHAIAAGVDCSAGCDNFVKSTQGIECDVGKDHVIIGTELYTTTKGIMVLEEVRTAMLPLQAEGKTAMIVANNGEVVGVIAVADVIRDQALDVVGEMKRRGMSVWMVTGDNERTAKAIASQVGIENLIAEVLPQGKVEKIKELQEQGKFVAMVGDGVNDSPALTQANVGIAIGAGTDIAIDAASIVLMSSNLYSVLTSIDISKRTFDRIKINFFFAFLYNCLGIPIAAGVFYPAFRLALPPWLAGLAMALSSVSIVLSSLLLKVGHSSTKSLKEKLVAQRNIGHVNTENLTPNKTTNRSKSAAIVHIESVV